MPDGSDARLFRPDRDLLRSAGKDVVLWGNSPSILVHFFCFLCWQHQSVFILCVISKIVKKMAYDCNVDY